MTKERAAELADQMLAQVDQLMDQMQKRHVSVILALGEETDLDIDALDDALNDSAAAWQVQRGELRAALIASGLAGNLLPLQAVCSASHQAPAEDGAIGGAWRKV